MTIKQQTSYDKCIIYCYSLYKYKRHWQKFNIRDGWQNNKHKKVKISAKFANKIDLIKEYYSLIPL